MSARLLSYYSCFSCIQVSFFCWYVHSLMPTTGAQTHSNHQIFSFIVAQVNFASWSDSILPKASCGGRPSPTASYYPPQLKLNLVTPINTTFEKSHSCARLPGWSNSLFIFWTDTPHRLVPQCYFLVTQSPLLPVVFFIPLKRNQQRVNFPRERIEKAACSAAGREFGVNVPPTLHQL
jgi:hypothetical protein